MIYNSRDYGQIRNFVLFISLIAWIVILVEPHASSCCTAASSPNSLATLLASNPTTSLARGWALMLIAMMAPMLVAPIYHISSSSFAQRRGRSIAVFVASYGSVWLAAGCIMVPMELAGRLLVAHPYLPAAVVGLAALFWQVSPFKQRCLNRCHYHRPLAAFGRAADWDVFRLGLEHGLWCIGSCWATMFFPMLLPQGNVSAMAAVSTLMFCERLDPPKPLAWRCRGFGSAACYLSRMLRRFHRGRALFWH